jgi:hypothetical protein
MNVNMKMQYAHIVSTCANSTLRRNIHQHVQEYKQHLCMIPALSEHEHEYEYMHFWHGNEPAQCHVPLELCGSACTYCEDMHNFCTALCMNMHVRIVVQACMPKHEHVYMHAQLLP